MLTMMAPGPLPGSSAVLELGNGPGAQASDGRTPHIADLAALKTSKITRAEALTQVETQYSPAIEVKFETGDDGTLSLSVYPVEKGMTMDAERNVFQDLSGNPALVPWTPKLDVFSDQEHLTRSARDLTIVQTSKGSPAQAVAKVDALGKGFVYWAIPTVREGVGGYGIYTVDDRGTSHYFFVNEGHSRRVLFSQQSAREQHPRQPRHPTGGM